MAELALIVIDAQWKSCLKSNLEQLSHSMSFANITGFLLLSAETSEAAIFLKAC